jgi:hypothetical protein
MKSCRDLFNEIRQLNFTVNVGQAEAVEVGRVAAFERVETEVDGTVF